MKNLFFVFLFAVSISAKSQSYGDSSITLTLTQRTAYWIGQYVRVSFTWSERNAPTQLKNYIGSGSNPDSVMTNITFKSKFLLGAMDALISQPLQVSYADYRAIVLNMPAVGGYTALVTQVNALAAGNGAQKLTAQWLKDQFALRTAAFDALYIEQKNTTIQWSRE